MKFKTTRLIVAFLLMPGTTSLVGCSGTEESETTEESEGEEHDHDHDDHEH